VLDFLRVSSGVLCQRYVSSGGESPDAVYVQQLCQQLVQNHCDKNVY